MVEHHYVKVISTLIIKHNYCTNSEELVHVYLSLIVNLHFSTISIRYWIYLSSRHNRLCPACGWWCLPTAGGKETPIYVPIMSQQNVGTKILYLKKQLILDFHRQTKFNCCFNHTLVIFRQLSNWKQLPVIKTLKITFLQITVKV